MTALAKRRETGKKGEELAATYLEAHGMEILHRNFRIREGEIDIIARDGDYLVFVEVKTDRSHNFGEPETWVTARKRRRIALAAEAYLQRYDIHDVDCRFDVVAIHMTKKSHEIHHIKNAFWIE